MLRVTLVLAAALVLVANTAAAQTAAPGDPGQRTFVNDYMAAVGAKDVAALRRLIHPASLACMNDSNRDFYDVLFANAVKEGPRSSYRITRIGPTTGLAEKLVPAGMIRYPVTPTHEVRIDFETGPNRSKTLIRQIAMADGSWLEVMPCPTPEGLEAFRRRQAGAQSR